MDLQEKATAEDFGAALRVIGKGCAGIPEDMGIREVLNARDELCFIGKRIARSRIGKVIPWKFKVDVTGEPEYDDEGGTYMCYRSDVTFRIPEEIRSVCNEEVTFEDDPEITVALDVGDLNSLELDPTDEALLMLGMSLYPPTAEGFKSALNADQEHKDALWERLSEMSECLGLIADGDGFEEEFN